MTRDCQCPRAQHQHGTRMAYDLDGCRCFPCRIASSHAAAAYTSGGTWTDGRYPSSAGVRRRLEALHANGWSRNQLAQRLGYTRRAIERYNNATNVLQATHDRIAALYDELWNVTPTGQRVGATKHWAARKGFLPPLAWDDDTIDNPHAWPLTIRLTGPYCDHCGHLSCAAARPAVDTLDDIAIEQAIGGRGVKLTKAERLEAVRRMTAAGMSAHQIGERLRVTSRTVQRRRAA